MKPANYRRERRNFMLRLPEPQAAAVRIMKGTAVRCESG